MLFSLVLAVTSCLVAGTIIIVARSSRAAADATVARVLYDTEHPEKNR